jgi:hypothetical protein
VGVQENVDDGIHSNRSHHLTQQQVRGRKDMLIRCWSWPVCQSPPTTGSDVRLPSEELIRPRIE